jgi:hypothetical protein
MLRCWPLSATVDAPDVGPSEGRVAAFGSERGRESHVMHPSSRSFSPMAPCVDPTLCRRR